MAIDENMKDMPFERMVESIWAATKPKIKTRLTSRLEPKKTF